MSSIKKASSRGSRRRHTIGSTADGSPTNKQVASNERRLEALRQRRKQLTAAHNKSITIDVDRMTANSANKRIVFDSDSSDEETERALSGKQSLDLFDEGEEEDIAAHFTTRKQFEGSSGEKLFRLQQQIGMDKRFRLDERFAVSSDEEGAESDSVKSDGGMEEEKEQSRRILASLLGTDSSVVKNKPPKPNNAFPIIRHFDPSSASCADMEQEIKPAPKDKPVLSSSEDEEIEDTQSPPPVSKESYYKVSSHLKDLLTDKEEREGKQHTFNFFASEEDLSDEDRESSPAEEENADIIKTTPKWMETISKSSEHAEEEDISDGVTPAQEPSKRLLFFFHSSDPLLCNRLNEENTFYRTKTPEELLEKWTERRAAVKLAYKRSRKQALKRTRKTNW